jgi:phytoene dehydrogenase-like protein
MKEKIVGNHKNVIVVGGGISGLTTATALVSHGIDVLLVEKNDDCGGLVNSFEREGFLFDGGIRALENAGMIKPMLKELEIDLPLIRSKISLGVEDDVIHVETEESIKEYENQLLRIYPESQADVVRVISVILKMKEHMNVLFGSDSPFFKDIKRDTGYYLTKFIVWLYKLAGTVLAIIRMKVPVEDFLDRQIKNKSLFDIISQHFFRNTPAFFAMSYFALYTDYYYPEGGVGQLPLKIKEKLTTLGGEVLTNTDITRVNLSAKTIYDQNGKAYSYEKLIWAADLKQLYRIISTEGLTVKIRNKVEKEKGKILSAKGAESVFTVFMGVNQDPSYFQNISYGHFFYTPSRKGLGNIHRSELKEMLDNWKNVTKAEVLEWMNRFCALNTYEISIPVLNDPQAAPEGKTGIIASLLLDYALVKHIEDDGWLNDFTEQMEMKIIDVLNRSIYPILTEKLIFSFPASPMSIEKRVRSSEGAIVGWSFEEPIPISASMINMKDSVRTSMPDVLKVGQWAASPAGLPTCILTAKLAADLVGKEFL